jgi:putative membrane protein
MSFPPLPLLHAGSPEPTGWLYSNWRPEPTVVLGIFALIAAYIWFTGPKNRAADGTQINPVSGGQRVAFVAGSLIALIALNPPIDDWSDHYLLSAHMGQHMLLIFVTVPLWLAGVPAWLLRRLVAREPINTIGYALTRPVPAFVISNAIITLWHLPVFYDAALRTQPLHVVEHLSFIFAAVLLWWPVFGPLPEWPRISSPLLQCLYLFANSIPGQIVGSFVTLAAPGLYTPYISSPRIWGISLSTDQQIAGLMMWVLSGGIFLFMITLVFFRWASKEEAKERYGSKPAPAADQGALSRRETPASTVSS